MKIFYTISVVITFILLYNLYKYRDVDISYNENGNKIVKVICESDFECKKLIGNECEELGYSVVEKTDQYQLAECGPNLDFLTYLNRKIIKILN